MNPDKDPVEEKIPASAIGQLFVYLENHNFKNNELLIHEELKNILAPVLSATGLEIESVRNGQSLSSSMGSEEGTELRVNIKDGKRFITFLKSIDLNSISEEDKSGLVKVAEVLSKQFVSQYDITDPNDGRFLELMGSLSNIISEYKRLDGGNGSLSSAIAPLEKYLIVARQGHLVEYRLAEELKLHQPFSGEGFILRWHIDCDAKFLNKKWNEVIGTLQNISQSTNIQDPLYTQAVSTAKAAVEAALRDVSGWGDNETGHQKEKKEFISILQNAKARLADF